MSRPGEVCTSPSRDEIVPIVRPPLLLVLHIPIRILSLAGGRSGLVPLGDGRNLRPSSAATSG